MPFNEYKTFVGLNFQINKIGYHPRLDFYINRRFYGKQIKKFFS